MLRRKTDEGWLLITHPDHARLAGDFARHWKNADFLPPEPFASLLDAVYRHDDAWRERDHQPHLTPEGEPAGFSEALVNRYSAFEAIDLEDYLAVRGQATERAAARDPFAAIVISMHTVNLLTEQADLTTLSEAQQPVHAAFVEGQQRRQAELTATLAADPAFAPFTTPEHLRRNFEFLQACDSLSLLACTDFSGPGQTLRHAHPDRQGQRRTITFERVAPLAFRLDPWPLDEPEIRFDVPAKALTGATFANLEAFRTAYAAAPVQTFTVTLHR